ncbi:GAF domain-containing protein [Thermomonospora amylolytica]|uniref:GAF domain-containing protein n=1 Tax=Thermomonospora amylolytica TaxID=1411117 RepID=UPI000E6C50E7|nr:helix-turn-helix domain-containing protein [Thermomonospora amylolytica]
MADVVSIPHTCRHPQDPARDPAGGRAAGADPEAGPDAARRRPAIRASWLRCRRAGVGTEIRAAPLVLDTGVLAEARAAHPLGRHLPMLRGLLRRVADESEHLMLIADAEGHALWSEAPPRLRRAADAVGLREGFCWSECSVGTNGIGTALATGRPEYVYAAEHLARVLHDWSCAGAPVRDPDTGAVVGCIDISATADALHPAVVGLVAAAARLAESRLELEMQARDERLRERYLRHLRGLEGGAAALVTGTGRVLAAESEGWRGMRLPTPADGARVVLPDGRTALAEALGEVFLLRIPEPGEPAGDRPSLTLSLLGDPPHALLDGTPLPLSLRHAEILALLALNPRGLSAERLSAQMYGDEGNPTTVRAEIHRLRGQFGGLLAAKPYRLECDVEADFLIVRRLLEGGRREDLAEAARLYQGELLPRSESPELRAERDELAVRLRCRLLDAGDPEALWIHAQSPAGQDDLEIWQRLAGALPPGDPRHAAVRSRIHRVLSDDGP